MVWCKKAVWGFDNGVFPGFLAGEIKKRLLLLYLLLITVIKIER